MKQLVVLLCLVGLAVAGPPVVKTKEEIEELRQALEKSRTDDGVLLEARMEANPKANVWENSGKWQGDILLDDDQVERMVSDYASGNAETRNAYIVANTRWPNNNVIWAFGANEFNAQQQEAIRTAMSWIEHFSCVRFRRRSNERTFVTIRGQGTGCYAHVGFSTAHPNRILNVARNTPGRGCLHNIVIIHEMLHSIGFQHMHQTSGRGSFVRINTNNIQANYQFAFTEFASNRVSLMRTNYEFTSMMHYTTHAFSRNGQPTITALRSFSGTMGQIQRVTDADWLRLRRHYNCPGAWSAGELDRIKAEAERMEPLMSKAVPAPKDGALDDIELGNYDAPDPADIALAAADDQESVNEDAVPNEDNTVEEVKVVDE